MSSLDRRARYDLAHLGEAIGDPGRAAMLVSLLGEAARPASELARIAGVTPSTAASHLKRLVEAGLLSVRPAGRHRYYSLSDARVAHAVEALGACVLERRKPSRADELGLSLARTCYGHLAGKLAVAFWDRARDERWVRWSEISVTLSPRGRDVLGRFELLAEPEAQDEGRPCLDWSERVPHVAGPLGVALCDALLARGWVGRERTGRGLRVTARGEQRFHELGVRYRA